MLINANEYESILRVNCLPDAANPTNMKKAASSFASSVRSAGQHLLYNTAELPFGSATIAIRYQYNPAKYCPQPQKRLNIYLSGRSHTLENHETVPILLENCLLGKLYNFDNCDKFTIDTGIYNGCCDITRKYTVLEPSVTAEMNSQIPYGGYFVIEEFFPSKNNTLIDFINFLSDVPERILVDLSIEPFDISGTLKAHNNYLQQLRRVNLNPNMTSGYPTGSFLANSQQGKAIIKSLHIKDPICDGVYREQIHVYENMASQRHLIFHIRVFAETENTARMVASVFAENTLEQGNYQLASFNSKDGFFKKAVECLKKTKVLATDHKITDSQPTAVHNKLLELTNLATVDELGSVFQLPIAMSYSSPKVILKDTDPPDIDPDDMIILGNDYEFIAHGNEQSMPVPRGIYIKDLNKHLLDSGKSGKGKTNTIVNLAHQLSIRKIPFILIECGQKTDYRKLKQLKNHPDKSVRDFARSLRIYTAGAKYSSFNINPLELNGDMSIEENIARALTFFQGFVPMEGSMQSLVSEALEKTYSDSPDPYNDPPKMKDLIDAVKEVLAGKDYSIDLKSDMATAINNRLSILTRCLIGRIFNCSKSIPSIEELIKNNSIVELSILSPTEQAAVVMSLLTMIVSLIKTTSYSGKGPRLMILIEEVHNVVGQSTDARASETNANPKAFTSELIACKLLPELRAEKVGVVNISQLSTNLAPEILKHSGAKIAHGVDEKDEREAAAGAMLFDDIQTVDIARLKPGEAYFITEGYFGSRKIVCPNLEAKWNIPDTPKNDAILDYMRDEQWFIDITNRRVTAELDQLRTKINIFNDTVRDFIDKTSRIVSSNASKKPADLASKAAKLQGNITKALKTFQWDTYRPLTDSMVLEDVISGDLLIRRKKLMNEFENVIKPAVEACVATLTRSTKKRINFP